MRILRLLVASSLCLAGLVAPSRAGEADVEAVEVRCRPAPGGRPASICQFSVTVRHADTGWDHYANRFQILIVGGEVLGTRILRHPHIEEQPFRRSLPRIRIAHTTERVEVRAGDLEHGLGGRTMTVDIPHAKGAGLEQQQKKAPAEPEPEAGESP